VYKLISSVILLFFYSGYQCFSQESIKSVTLNEVVIKSKSLSRTSFSVDTISSRNINNSSFADVGSALKTIPNVSTVKKGVIGLDPVVRGFKYSQINVLLNGSIKVEGGCPNRMDPAASHVDVYDIKKIELFKGTNAIKYGPAFGGTINLVTWKPAFYQKYKTDIEGFVGIQSNGPGFHSKIKVGGANRFITYSVAAGAKNFNDYKDGNGNYIKSSATVYDFSGYLGFLISKHHLIDAGVIVSRGQNVDFPSLSMDEREDNTNIYSLNYSFLSNKKNVNRITVKSWLSDVNHLMDNKNRPFSDTVVATSSIHAVDAGLRGYGNFSILSGILETGFDYEFIFKDGTRQKYFIKQPGLPVKKESLWNNAQIRNTGLYLRYIHPGKQFDWIASIRFDNNFANSDSLFKTTQGENLLLYDNTESKYFNISGNIGITWHTTENNDLSLSIGRGVRSPDMTERFIILLPIGYDNFDYLGNPLLKPEENYEINLKNKYINDKIGTFNVSVFFSFVTNFIGGKWLPPSQIRPQTPGVLGVKEFVNYSKVWLTGFEFSYKTNFSKRWQVLIDASYTYGRNPEAEGYELENDKIIDIYTIYNDPLPEIPPFEFNLNFKYGFFKNTLVPEVHWRAVAAQNKISESYMEEKSFEFQILDLKLKYTFNKYFTVYGGINNLFDKYYFEHLNRNIIGSDKPLYERGRNFYLNFIVKF